MLIYYKNRIGCILYIYFCLPCFSQVDKMFFSAVGSVGVFLLAHKYFLIFNHRKITEFKGLYNEKKTKLCKSRN